MVFCDGGFRLKTSKVFFRENQQFCPIHNYTMGKSRAVKLICIFTISVETAIEQNKEFEKYTLSFSRN